MSMQFLERCDRFDLPERTAYVESTNAFLTRELAEAKKRRAAYTLETPVEERREAFRKMLGYPLSPSPEKNEIRSKKTFLHENGGVKAYSMQLEILPEVWLYGILLEPKVILPQNALVIFQHGGLGTPELIGSVVEPTNYHYFARKAVTDGVFVFCPQLFHWSVESWGSSYNGAHIDSLFRMIGGSKTAFGVYCIERTIDYFEALPEIDAERIGMAGLSYGGMYTLVTAAVEPRICVAVSSCYLNNREKYAWNDWCYRDQANQFFDAEILTLIAPRPFFAEAATRDQVFSPEGFEEVIADYGAYREKLALPDTCVFHLFEGKHEFAEDDENLRFLQKHL